MTLDNRITSVEVSGVAGPSFVHDRRGNLVYDGDYVYAYDAFNRLVGVYERGTAEFDAATGRITSGTLGTTKAVFAYDAVGRLMTFDNGSQTEHYYYDGVRRIQALVAPNADPENDETRAEYVYGTDYVDEFVLQTYKAVDPQTQQPAFFNAYVLQDANYNVVGLVDGSGQVLQQYVWEPYGTVLSVETPIATPPPLPTNTVGHQGLFFYRFNPSGGDTAPLATTAIGLYHYRNRWYSPRLGRFTSVDPNGSGSIVLAGAGKGGDPTNPFVGQFDLLAHYGDGTNLYLYLLASPFMWTDPLGLSSEINHIYPCYLGGPSNGPGVELEFKDHREVFHRYLSTRLGGGTWKSQRDYWATLSDSDRLDILTMASKAAGVDVDDPAFVSALQEAYAGAEHGVKQEWGAPREVKVRRLARGATGRFVDGIPGVNKLRSVAVGVAFGSAVLQGLQMAGSLNISNLILRDLAAITRRARSGNLSMIDEVGALDDLYQLTGEHFSAMYAWDYWREGLGY